VTCHVPKMILLPYKIDVHPIRRFAASQRGASPASGTLLTWCERTATDLEKRVGCKPSGVRIPILRHADQPRRHERLGEGVLD
jgi:hypothetical protein